MMNITFEHFVERCAELGVAWPDRTSLQVLFGDVPPHVSAWKKLLRQAYGQKALALGYRLFGRALPLSALDAIGRRAAALDARIAESPALAGLLVPFVRVDTDIPADFGAIRTPALGRGLSAGSWRWLTRQPAQAVQRLTRLGWTGEAIFWMNRLALARQGQPELSARWYEAGRPYAMQQFYTLLTGWGPDTRELAHACLERYLRVLPSQACPRTLAEHERIVAELLTAMQRMDFSLVATGQTWKGLLAKVRARQEAREAAAREKAAALAQGATLKWAPVLGSLTLDGIVVTELTSEAELIEEGVLMSHCVGNGAYGPLCAVGESLILRLEHEATRVRATLQLSRPDAASPWRIAQLAGPGNATPPAVFWSCAQSVRQHLMSPARTPL